MSASDSTPEKETFFLHDISPQLESELMRRAKARGRDASSEASEIIEEHIEEEDSRLD
jgi:hypothetical protein